MKGAIKAFSAGNTQSITIVDWNRRGGADAGLGTSFATYRAACLSLFTSVNTTPATQIFGQALPPLIPTDVVDGGQPVSAPDSAGIYMPVTAAQADLAG